ncbi:outer membrane beta-barrel protein [Helicobacter salomonis]|uniref:outer membrane beta-barrel protein n=1 Tax=Helicobacter salomonis TaxID=56878 RepID=UPI000CF0A543|nr:outer membrane beta-barrel protein [Helicobacter salomonis]
MITTTKQAKESKNFVSLGFDLTTGYAIHTANNLVDLRTYGMLSSVYGAGPNTHNQNLFSRTSVGLGINAIINFLSNVTSGSLFGLGIFAGVTGMENNYSQGQRFAHDFNLNAVGGLELRFDSSGIQIGVRIPIFERTLRFTDSLAITNSYKDLALYANYLHYF